MPRDEGALAPVNVPSGSDGPLAGVVVVELGSFIAGPFAGQLLGDYGATVIKVEPPDGDVMRTWGVCRDGVSLWWPTIGRNKLSVCMDLHVEAARDALRQLIQRADMVIENFRPGRLEEWGLDFETLASGNAGLVMVRLSGYGQTGPKASSAGFGSIGEAMGGIRFVTGDPDRPPSRSGVSLGDSLAALFSVIGGLSALLQSRAAGVGQVVDVAIYEAVAALMESTLADFEVGGVLRQRSGSVLPGVAPSNVYPTRDGSEVIIAANGDGVFTRLCAAMGTPDLATDVRFADHASRGANMEVLDELIAAWTSSLDLEELQKILDGYKVPNGRVYSAADMLDDEQYRARAMVQRVRSAVGYEVPMTGVVPRFTATPGRIAHPGAPLGAHTREVLTGLGMLTDEEFEALKAEGAVVEGQ